MTDQADDIPPIESVDPQPSPVAPAPLTAVEAVAEALAAIHAREPDLAIDLRDNLRRCSINELVRLFGAPQIVNALLSGASPATMPLEANGEPVEKLSGEGAPVRCPRLMARSQGPRRAGSIRMPRSAAGCARPWSAPAVSARGRRRTRRGRPTSVGLQVRRI
jgi:hypothetical protein